MHSEVKELWLANNLFGDVGVETILTVMPNFGYLETLSLGGCQMNDDSVKLLSTSLTQLYPCNLKHLYLNSNCIGDAGIMTLCIPLNSSLVPLRTLHLGDNQFTPACMPTLASVIEYSEDLKFLYLNDNEIDIVSLSESLCINRSI